MQPDRETQLCESVDLFDALDLPEQVQAMQTLYWEAKREWQKLDAAYHVVLEDMLKRTGDLP